MPAYPQGPPWGYAGSDTPIRNQKRSLTKMKRCNSDAYAYSWFNGFRTCTAHLSRGLPGEFDAMVATDYVVGPCDVPIHEQPNGRYVSTPDGIKWRAADGREHSIGRNCDTPRT